MVSMKLILSPVPCVTGIAAVATAFHRSADESNVTSLVSYGCMRGVLPVGGRIDFDRSTETGIADNCDAGDRGRYHVTIVLALSVSSRVADMDVDAEAILALMFPDGYPGVWKTNVDVSEFLCELGSFGQADLDKNSRHVDLEANSNLERTRELAFHNYGTFIETADCARDIAKDFGKVEENLKRFIDGCPQFSQRCSDFERRAHALLGHRKLTSLALARHTQLLEILELPQLMDTCVRNGYCEEALQLAQYVQRLEKKHGKISIIQDIVCNVQRSQRLLVKQLLAQIGSPSQLPQCLKLLGYLRRLEVFSAAQLRVKFLQARTAWLNSAVDGVLKDDAYYHLNKVIELYRVHLFDIITQYRALFSSLATTSAAPGSLVPKDDEHVELTYIFHGWVLYVVRQFLSTLEGGLSNASKVVSRMDSLLGQCTYFATSLSRVGVDFTPQVQALFTRTALGNFRESLDSAESQFRTRLESFSSVLVANVKFNETSSASKDDLHPPLSLLDFQPLAHLMNDWLRALNDLTACVQLNSGRIVTRMLDAEMRKIADALAVFFRREKKQRTRPNIEDGIEAIAKLFVRAFSPHVGVCLRVLFPPEKISQKVGLTMDQLEADKFLGCCLDLKEVCRPLDEFIRSQVAPCASPVPPPVTKINESSEVGATAIIEN